MTGAWALDSPLYILPDCGLVRGASTSEVDDGLYVGSRPPPGSRLGPDFGALVLCAREYQTSADYPCVVVLRCPLDDSGPPPTVEEVNRAHGTAFLLARRLRDGHRALVTCAQGVNRSALVAALAMAATVAYLSYNVLPRGDPPAGGWRLTLWYLREFTMVLSRYETMGGTKPLGKAETTPASTIKALTPVPATFPPSLPAAPPHLPLPAPIPREDPLSVRPEALAVPPDPRRNP